MPCLVLHIRLESGGGVSHAASDWRASINGFNMRCPCLQIEWDWRRINYNGEIEDKLLEKEHWRGLIQIRQKQVIGAVQWKRVLECCTTCLPVGVLVSALSEGCNTASCIQVAARIRSAG